MEIEPLFGAATELKFSIALWKLPGDEGINAIVDLSGKVSSTKIEFKNQESGFALSPFINPKGKSTLFLNADLSFDSKSKGLIEHDGVKKDREKQKRKEKLLQSLQRFGDHPEIDISAWHHPTVHPETQTSKTRYCRLVAKAVNAVCQKEFRKLVLSRTKVVSLPRRFRVVKFFQNLCKTYPDAFVSVVSIPGIGTWIGASPEILVSISRTNLFHTVSLAGTRRIRGKAAFADKSVWTEKEREEQAWVSRYIINCFRKVGLKEVQQEGPRVVKAGNLLHLKTDFTVEMRERQASYLGGRMLKRLHPTPAVCGVPKKKALAFIAENEGYDRKFYAGFLGPVNFENESHLFVNLRCMQLYRRKAVLYAGAGITDRSVPEKEWQETEIKCDTLLRVMSRE